MAQRGVGRRVTFVDLHGESNPQLPSVIVKEEQKDDEGTMAAESAGMPGIRKRKRLTLNQLREAKAAKRALQRQNSSCHKHKQSKHDNSIDRWSVDRYKLAEQSMLDVMKAAGAVFENPISRTALRMAARQHIGDTGLLDHLLKHIDGKVAPGGADRFRRCYNTDGVMEYWLENADLVKIKREAGVPDPSWLPPSWWKTSGGPFQDSVCAEEIKLLKSELDKMKRDMQHLVPKTQEQGQVNPVEEIRKELVNWKVKTDQRLIEISSSLSGMQEMYRELVTWKAKTEQQLTEISNSLSILQASQPFTTFNPPASERWEDWLESSNLDNITGEELAPWFESTDVVNVGQEGAVQEPYLGTQPQMKPGNSPTEDPICTKELELLKEGMAQMKRDVHYLVPKTLEEDQVIVTPDSSVTANSKLDLDNSLLLFQEMFKELAKWKTKMEQQMVEISNSVSAMQVPKKWTS